VSAIIYIFEDVHCGGTRNLGIADEKFDLLRTLLMCRFDSAAIRLPGTSSSTSDTVRRGAMAKNLPIAIWQTHMKRKIAELPERRGRKFTTHAAGLITANTSQMVRISKKRLSSHNDSNSMTQPLQIPQQPQHEVHESMKHSLACQACGDRRGGLVPGQQAACAVRAREEPRKTI
jgi:hypothetical protein